MADLPRHLSANNGILNQTSGSFGINASEAGDVADIIDNGSEVAEFFTVKFDQLVTFDQLVLSSFTSAEDASLNISAGSPITLVGTGPSRDIYNFSTDNIIPIGQLVKLEYSTGNGFSFDEFTVTPAESTVVPEPASVSLLIIGLVGLGGRLLRERSKRQAKQQNQNLNIPVRQQWGNSKQIGNLV
ncbi:MAG: PEP-CTERM sorting domain-containing protein [Candidatus Scalindua sp.]|nr:PEP-CTERM sorting domain-containing protein [Candidatus Scalindua sp.]MBT5304481.1 PEP-CTERM sorting domain-containing protein [Candidatus Scalindua sp.]MBT6226556.1 PEP-CTERM sorting domain-containing protein [Candidatus Scalindua sp.]MBT6563778.1 PEP-CTERM sorting domain-containing protein [Candidatus Scalindua sp.]MBT7210916.1 PEP-CTERM sorting domain-containing protein [Candidatus Scalindua sp.]